MTNTKNYDAAIDVVKNNPHTGTTKNIVTLSVDISKSKKSMDKSIFNLYKEKSQINDKIFSKLKVIGDKLSNLNNENFKEVVEQLPPSYQTIHALCSLRSEEIFTAVKTKCVTKTITYREAVNYVKQVKYPHLLAKDGDKARGSTKQEHLWSIYRTDDVCLEGAKLQDAEEAFRRICKDYGLVLRKAKETKISVIRNEERRERSAYWRRILEGEITQKWFADQDDKLKKKFNIKNADELRDTPLRQFTGFLINAIGGREYFWNQFGKAYVAKVYFLLETAEDAASRYNYRKRIEEVLGNNRELAIWRNIILKQSGFI